MKRYKQLIVGLVVGSMLGMGGSVFAENSSVISVFVKKAIHFEFNGEKKELPKDTQAFSYKGNTYLPVKFIAQNLDTELKWDQKTKVLSFTAKKKEDENVAQQSKKNDYKELPIKKLVGDAWVEITGINVNENDGFAWVYLEVENKKEIPIQIDQMRTKIILEDEIYEQSTLRNIINPYDNIWFNDIRKDDEINGFIKMPLPKDGKKLENFTLVLNVIQNDEKQKKTEVKFNIAK
ncbi:MAG: copper amine oxidase N-terminal domain-containing protein [Marinisporobacter sp.]|jgi:hypothetical protein|nr:copper amine oxidase N-terminal domain-containing protein [Marinisporobacter sp.]